MQGKSGHRSTPERRKIALALQGGGSHGAFTWGVLDRLLEDPTIEIVGVTGTSAGAMNSVVLADGVLGGGPEGGRQRLRAFWEAIGKMPGFGTPLWPLSGEMQSHVHLEQTPAYLAWDLVSRNLSPSQLNPMNFNPLREPLTELVDFERIRAQKELTVMVCATNARTSWRRVFHNKDISVDAVLASACLPQMFPPVMIDGQPYWDGGFTGNPAMMGLFPFLPKSDLIIVRIDPIIRVDVPQSVREIHDRVTEVSFNSTFWMEAGAIGMLLKMKEAGWLKGERFERFNFHAIQASEHLEKIPASTKINNSPQFLEFLFGLGRTTAEEWLAKNGEAIGRRSTIDLTKLLPQDIVAQMALRTREYEDASPAGD
ncbi:MAG TPA: patatin-like phospholipase family protein [Alphaproteobacteria bacterium]|nr:patatin-like phospholipase family protein [Alphaproteobacteria bacterium]